ncbi:hypothetical protein H2200_012161 [Cladophialophora chaetospira]|uniref:SAP domain-containing protein n=1 Tax=Cladophialophora chaetospira TaxID=386627 RepID=A0AA38WYC0_9EURO|nr:hypothetical protein H2200_012161 [Cladophialophora chaetospira]
MAGTKRALSQVDGNVAKAQPPSKRTTSGAASGKENVRVDYASMKKDELSTILRAHGLPYSGNKDTLIRRLEENEKKHSSVDTSEKAVTKKISAAKGAAQHKFDYWTICRPSEDIRAEKEANDEDYNSEEDEEEEDQVESDEEDNDQSEAPGAGQDGPRKSICGQKNCICKLPASENPSHNWLLTQEGYLMVARLQYEVDIRDQEAIQEHYFSDFSGYGFQEVMENQLLAFNSEHRKKHANPAVLWSFIEAFAWSMDDMNWWFNVDDPETVLDTLRMIGGAVFTTLSVLEQQGLLCPDSAVKNISLVLAKLYENTADWPSGDEEPELAWRGPMIKEAKHHGIVFKDAPYAVESMLQQDDLSCPQNGKGYTKWKTFNWSKQFTAFEKKHRTGSGRGASIGGRHYALETEQERAQARINYTFWPTGETDSEDDGDGLMTVYVG